MSESTESRDTATASVDSAAEPEMGGNRAETAAPAEPAPSVEATASAPSEPAPPVEATASAPSEPAPPVEATAEAPSEPTPPVEATAEAPSEPTPPVEAAASAPSEPTEGEAGVAETAGGELPGGSEVGDAGETQSSAGGEGAVEATTSAGDEAGKAKRKRRRRRKKKPGEGGEGESAGEADSDSDSERHDRKQTSAPFLKYFEGHQAARRHAFSPGELIAGRVIHVDEGVIHLDLFGKATAIVDRFEPREIEPLPEPTPVAVEPAAQPELEGADDAALEGSSVAAPLPEAAGEPTAEAAGEPTAEEASEATPAPHAEVPAEVAPPAAPVEGAPSEPAAQAASDPTSGAEPLASGAATSEATANVADEPPAEDAPAAADASVAETTPGEVLAPAADATPEASPAEAGPPLPAEHATESGLEAAAAEDGSEEVGPPPEPPPAPGAGEILRGRVGAVSECGHVAIVNRAIDRNAARAALERAREDKRRIWGIVFGFNRGGFDVLAEGIRVFCPASGMSLEHIEDPHVFVGQKLEFTVPPRKGGGQGIVVSRRTIVEREARKARKARLKSLEAGQVLDGRVTQVREFGAFVDVGDGLEGLVHQTELAWGRGVRPEDAVRPGDEVKVKVLKIGSDGDKKDRRDRQTRVSLSIKALLPDPWDEHAEALKEGSVQKGKVVRATDFGAFIELAPGIEGLLHISELGKDLKHADQAVQPGEEIDVVIERVDRSQRRISLSRLSPAEVAALAAGTLDLSQRPQSLKSGSHVIVVVERVEHHGVLVQVRGVLGKRGRGYLPNRELGTQAESERKKVVKVGAEIEVKIVGTDRDGGLRCSIRGLETDEERRAVRDYRKEAAKQGFGTFGDLLRAKLGDEGSNEGA